MKKALILAYDFPPYVSVGGLRPYKWFKYFYRYGVFPVLITRQWNTNLGSEIDYISPGNSNEEIIEENSEGIIIRAPYHPTLANRLLIKYGPEKFKWIRKTITAFYEFIQYIFISGPKSDINKAAEQYLSKNQVDVIIATGEPFVLFYYASLLGKKYKTPWIADYRDPWSNDINRKNTRISEAYDKYLEKKITSTSSLITTVSETFKDKIREIVPGKNIEIIPNGFDPENFHNLNEPNKEILTIGFAGTIYSWHPWKIFLLACLDIIKEKKAELQIHFYGINIEEEMRTFISENKAENIVILHEKLPNISLTKELSKHNLLLLFNYFSIVGTKIYDYLALRRKILLCFSENLTGEKNYDYEKGNKQEEIILETNSGISVKNVHHLKKVLMELFSEFKNTGLIKVESKGIEKYSSELQVQKLAELIHKLKI